MIYTIGRLTYRIANVLPELLLPRAMLRILLSSYTCLKCSETITPKIGFYVRCDCGTVLWHYNYWHLREFVKPIEYPYVRAARLLLTHQEK